MFSDLPKLLYFEVQKYKFRGFYSVLALFMLYSYFAYFPLLVLSLYKLVPLYSPYTTFVIGTFLVHLSIYLGANFFFLCAYKLNHPLIESWKINKSPWPWQSNPYFSSQIRKVFINFSTNNLFITLPLLLLDGLTVRYNFNPDDFPSLLTNFYHICFFLIAEDCVFYWSHRTLHLPKLYGRIHKKHHEFNVTVSIVSEYAHPIEYIFGNLLPIEAGPMILSFFHVHFLTWILWLNFRLLHTAEGHSGYCIPWSPFRFLPFGVTSEFHDAHHLKNKGNYSRIFLIWDTICGTNQDIENSKRKSN